MLLLQVEASREQPLHLYLETPPPSRGHHRWRKSAQGQRWKAWGTVPLRLTKRRSETTATEGRGGTALQEKAAIVRSPEMMEGDPAEVWMCSHSVVQGATESLKATKVA